MASKKIRVKVVKSFSANLGDEIELWMDGRLFTGIVHFPEGKEFNLPEGADWLRAGFVVPVREEEVEMATRKPQEKAVTRSKRKTTRKKKSE